jgi:rhamnogalacturonan hydrolase
MRLLGFFAVASPALAATTCNVLDYGAEANNSTDIGPALKLAYSRCVATAVTTSALDTVLFVPTGSFLLASKVEFLKAKFFTLTINGDLYMPFDSSLQGTMLQWDVSELFPGSFIEY